MSVVAYLRVSTRAQDDPENGRVSLETQEATIRNYANSNGFIIDRVVHDVGSGYRSHKLKGMKSLADTLKYDDKLIFHDISRFSRSVSEGTKLANLFKTMGVSLYSVVDNCSYSDLYDMDKFNRILCSSEAEYQKIKQRSEISLNRRRARGDYIGSAGYGFKLERNSKKSVIIRKKPDEQKVISKIMELHKAKKSNKTIAETLNSNKILKNGCKWTSSSINTIIKNKDRIAQKNKQASQNDVNEIMELTERFQELANIQNVHNTRSLAAPKKEPLASKFNYK